MLAFHGQKPERPTRLCVRPPVCRFSAGGLRACWLHIIFIFIFIPDEKYAASLAWHPFSSAYVRLSDILNNQKALGKDIKKIYKAKTKTKSKKTKLETEFATLRQIDCLSGQIFNETANTAHQTKPNQTMRQKPKFYKIAVCLWVCRGVRVCVCV